MIVSFKDFLTRAERDGRVRTYIASSPQGDSVFRQLSARRRSEPLVARKTRILFGQRSGGEGVDLRFITNSKYIRLQSDLNDGLLGNVDEECPSVGEIARACAHDFYSTPFLLSTSSDLFASDVWIDELDDAYLLDMAKSIVCAVAMFDGDVAENDRKKRDMFLKIMPAGISAGVVNADEICHRGGTIGSPSGDLDARLIKDRIALYNSRIDTYRRIVGDERSRQGRMG